METQLSFFNTIDLKGSDLKGARESCNRQEERILEIMKNLGFAMTPAEVCQHYGYRYAEIPLTSCRRAMTCLTKKGFLEKLDEMKEGIYGKLNHKWRVK